jgi:hypothetical protein
MIPAFYYGYTGHSLGVPGDIAVGVALVGRLGWMYWRRRSRG